MNMGEGKTPFGHELFEERIQQFGRPLLYAEENVAWSKRHKSIAQTDVNGWTNNERYRANMLGAFQYCGIGVYKSSYDVHHTTCIFANFADGETQQSIEEMSLQMFEVEKKEEIVED